MIAMKYNVWEKEKVLEEKRLMIRMTQNSIHISQVFIRSNPKDGGGTNSFSSVVIEGDGEEWKMSEPLYM